MIVDWTAIVGIGLILAAIVVSHFRKSRRIERLEVLVGEVLEGNRTALARQKVIVDRMMKGGGCRNFEPDDIGGHDANR